MRAVLIWVLWCEGWWVEVACRVCIQLGHIASWVQILVLTRCEELTRETQTCAIHHLCSSAVEVILQGRADPREPAEESLWLCLFLHTFCCAVFQRDSFRPVDASENVHTAFRMKERPHEVNVDSIKSVVRCHKCGQWYVQWYVDGLWTIDTGDRL